MKAIQPHVEVPGDNEETVRTLFAAATPGRRGVEVRPNIMSRNGTCVGMSRDLAVWRFGQLKASEAGNAYGVHITETDNEYGFLWVLATRRTGKVNATFRGYAIELPKHFRRVIYWEAV